MITSVNAEHRVGLFPGDQERPRPRRSIIAPKKLWMIEQLRWAAISLSASCLFYLGQIRSWTSEQNRYHYFWEAQDSLALVLNILAIAVALFTTSLLARCIRQAGFCTFAKYLFLLFLADSAISTVVSLFLGVGFTRKYDLVFWLAWSIIALVIFFARAMLWKPALIACLILSPLPILLIPQILSFSCWDPRSVSQFSRLPVYSDSDRPTSQTPVFIFVFDEWSYTRTFQGHNISDALPNLCAFVEGATVFHNARSPASATLISLPRIIFQSADGSLQPRRGRLYWETSQGPKQLDDIPTVFDGLLNSGYEVRVLGFYHPYEILFAGRRVLSHSYPNDPNYDNLLAQIGYFFVTNLRFLTDPLSRILWRWSDSQLFSLHWYALSRDFEEQAFSAIESATFGTCLFIHWPLPHGPFILNADGGYAGPYNSDADRMAGTPDDYQRHLQRLDRIIGEIATSLKRKGLFDEALVILTSDHSWRRDPDLLSSGQSSDLCHVPLLVKYPGQDRRADHYEPISLSNMSTLFESMMAGGAPAAVPP